MSKAPTAGIIMSAVFVRPGSVGYAGFVDYMDRSEAVRNENFDKFNPFQPNGNGTVFNAIEGAGETMFGDYNEYMDNPEKTSALFSRNYDKTPQEVKEYYKSYFTEGMENESPLWQFVFSFKNDWLVEHNMMNPTNNTVDETRLLSATRIAMSELEKREGLNGEWTGAIHYNTKHVHVHVGMVERQSTREYFHYIDKKNPAMTGWQYKGKFLAKNIKATKRKFINVLLDKNEELNKIDQLMKQTVTSAKENKDQFVSDRYEKLFQNLYEKLPKDQRKWAYGYAKGQRFKNEIDQMIHFYLNTDGKQFVEELKAELKPVSDEYEKAYGNPQNKPTFEMQKLYGKEGLYHKLGNVILKEMKQYIKSIEHKQEAFGRLSNEEYQELRTDHIVGEEAQQSGNFYNDFDSLEQMAPPVQQEEMGSNQFQQSDVEEKDSRYEEPFVSSPSVTEENTQMNEREFGHLENRIEPRMNEFENLEAMLPPEEEMLPPEPVQLENLKELNPSVENAVIKISEYLKKRKENGEIIPHVDSPKSAVPEKRGVRIIPGDGEHKAGYELVTIKPKVKVNSEGLVDDAQSILPSKETIQKYSRGQMKTEDGNLDNFSKNNKKMILTQCPEASYVYGKYQWALKKREPLPDVVPITIIAPVLENNKIVSFETIEVFDISQTKEGLSKESVEYLKNHKPQNGSKVKRSHGGGGHRRNTELEDSLRRLQRGLENKTQEYLNELAYKNLTYELSNAYEI